jgi:hypothetical protein
VPAEESAPVDADAGAVVVEWQKLQQMEMS